MLASMLDVAVPNGATSMQLRARRILYTCSPPRRRAARAARARVAGAGRRTRLVAQPAARPPLSDQAHATASATTTMFTPAPIYCSKSFVDVHAGKQQECVQQASAAAYTDTS